ncbi:MAG: hypothetical protein M3P48_00405 [Actinomycetota bacterium]|nr:hypothetical protein [Actinomycetota bacterium]
MTAVPRVRGVVTKWVPGEGWGLVESPDVEAACRVEEADMDLPPGDVLRVGDPVEFVCELPHGSGSPRARHVARWLEPLQGTTGG